MKISMNRKITEHWICINVFVKSRFGNSIYKHHAVVYEGAIKKKRNPHIKFNNLFGEEVNKNISDRVGRIYRIVQGGIWNEGYRKVY